GDAVDGIGLVEEMLAIAEARGVDGDPDAAVLRRVRPALVRAQAQAELDIELVKLRRAVAREAQRDLERGKRGERSAAEQRRALHGLPQSPAAINCAASAITSKPCTLRSRSSRSSG